MKSSKIMGVMAFGACAWLSLSAIGACALSTEPEVDERVGRVQQGRRPERVLHHQRDLQRRGGGTEADVLPRHLCVGAAPFLREPRDRPEQLRQVRARL